MCTAISCKNIRHYFGRNLDLEYHYKEYITVTPRKYPFHFRCEGKISTHYAMIGMATIENDYPLYYDATNECGLSVAGLNFPGNAHYFPPQDNKYNIASFELIPWLLGRCKNIGEVISELSRLNIANNSFSEKFPTSPLHWLVSDGERDLVIEQTLDGLKYYENVFGVLTNNPPFPYHVENLKNYMHLSPKQAVNLFAPGVPLQPYSNGMGAMGLPGDLSSASRFVRAAFTKLNSVYGEDNVSNITQFFHILDTVKQTKGSSEVNDSYEITLYSSCCDTQNCIYYYKTYLNAQISAIHMHHTNLDTSELSVFPMISKQNIYYQN